MVTVKNETAQYSDRGALVSEMCELLKAARTPLSKEWEAYGLDGSGLRLLNRLVQKLSEHLYFEHRTRQDLAQQLRAALVQYKTLLEETPRPKAKEFAAGVLDALMQPPADWLAYLGVHHLDLPTGMSVGDVRFIHIDEEDGLTEALSHFGERAPKLLCIVPAVAGTDDLALARARRSADSALALIRQEVLYGFAAKMHLDQVTFGLDGTYARKIDGEFPRTGWWAREHPMDIDLSAQHEWASTLMKLSERRDSLAAKLRESVDTGLDWLDVAARTGNWRIKLPAIFSAMEALLLPENSGLKAGALTVRSVAVHVALDEPFFEPIEIVEGYLWRSDLVHGAPTRNLNEMDLTALAEDRQMWAFRVFSDYVRLASSCEFRSVETLVSYLDTEHGERVSDWLVEHGGTEIVREYRKMLSSRATK
jgi:hypothetical protein